MEYKVKKIESPLTVDGDWDKEVWQRAESLTLDHHMGDILKFRPTVEAKLLYDSTSLYVIFKVNDQFVKCRTTEPNGPVWTDSCAEFFFAPNLSVPERYFNLEVNCGGTPLMFYNLVPRKDFTVVDADELAKLEIAHSLPKSIEEEISEPIQWTLEYRLPLDLISRYAEIEKPKSGVIWNANFYKIADETSNPHYLTWNPVQKAEPDFHLPEFFGKLLFE
ncbi:carbohydrate-binding family 9-like protein [Mangrovibacterium diazotrophicum]|uniref:Cellulose/xylan binding protein with CBM9 domain n=1 Tax=Mangrovibacterium diazotrophicum TaxID=1261403 RepID=A0A419W319_9BACT|nr:carbohydrate-binding family 9-like protein [Mangrovibacterium diazotrophicum]RKD89824.1 cellulose/xylan binding protein with CBM9 domain [Mangrovibacterium diazotrophicum]